jgi:hypothetical protein
VNFGLFRRILRRKLDLRGHYLNSATPEFCLLQCFAGDAVDPCDVEEFNNLAIILAKLARAPWQRYNVFVKRNGNLYSSEPAETGIL